MPQGTADPSTSLHAPVDQGGDIALDIDQLSKTFHSYGRVVQALNNVSFRVRHGMFIGQHGSWNRRPHNGYKVIFVPFERGKPAGAPIDVLTGFLSEEGNAFGRPVGVVIDKDDA